MFAGAGQRLVLMLVLEMVTLKAGPLDEDSKTFKSVPLNQAKQSPCTRQKATICLALNKSANLDGLTQGRLEHVININPLLSHIFLSRHKVKLEN